MDVTQANVLDSGDSSLFDVRSNAPGAGGALPITAEMLLTRPSGDLFGWSQNAGMGWDPRALGGKEILILSTHGGIRDADGAPIALGYHTGHWEVGLADGSRRAGIEGAGRGPVRGLLHRSVRRPHAGHHRDVRQPALSQRRGHRLPPPDPLAAHAQRRHRRGHLRQRAAGHDDGAGRHARSALRAGAGRRHACWPRKARTPDACRSVGARFAHGQITLEDGRRESLPRLRHARRRLPVSGHRGDFAGGGRGAGHVAAARRAGAFGTSHLAGHGAPFGARGAGAGSPRRHDARHPDRCLRCATPWWCMRPSADRPT